MRMDAYDYALPPDRIAQYPPEDRAASRLLVMDRERDALRDSMFAELPRELRPGDLLVVNDTAVFPARLYARRPSGARIEFLLAEPAGGITPDLAVGDRWKALVRPAKRARPGDRLALLGHDGSASDATIEIVGGAPGTGEREVSLETPGDPWSWILENGHMPLPPYIDRDDEAGDRSRYQTIYAAHRGAIAAPTAGLHFTRPLLDRLERDGIRRATITLHVGPGTFRPVTAERAEDHVMDAEWYRVPRDTIDAISHCRSSGGRVVAVGTTTVRALESLESDREDGPRPAAGRTDLFIRPGHTFRWVDALITNFHLPRSTLLLLVAAFAGRDRTLAAYRHAVEGGYRFYSYGDAMLIV